MEKNIRSSPLKMSIPTLMSGVSSCSLLLKDSTYMHVKIFCFSHSRQEYFSIGTGVARSQCSVSRVGVLYQQNVLHENV